MYTHRKLADPPIRKGRGLKRALESSEDEGNTFQLVEDSADRSLPAPPPKKGRGRPIKKQSEPENAASPSCKLCLFVGSSGWNLELLIWLNLVPPIKKGRGRPKKNPIEVENVNSVPPVKRGKGRPKKETAEPENVDSVSPIKRGKGRPKKEIPETENVDSVPAMKRGKGRPKKEKTEPESLSRKFRLDVGFQAGSSFVDMVETSNA